MRALLLLLLTLTPALAAPPSAAPPSAAPPSVAPASAPISAPELPALVRRLLDGRMLRHGGDLGALENAVHAGDHTQVALRARSIADEPRLARPAPLGSDGLGETLNQAIPPGFFDFQDLLHSRAEALEAAARAGDGPRVKAAYEALGQTCGQCHQVWFPVSRD